MFHLDDKEFTWSEAKNRENIKKHGISFLEALPVFLDPYLVIVYDEIHSSHEETRWKGIGILENQLLFSIVFTESQNDMIRIISVREASIKEKGDYRESIAQIFGY